MSHVRPEPAIHVVPHAEGKIHAVLWRPSKATVDSKAPIILFHDSLGSVDLWRQLPEQVCHATGRDVIAYDRLGFGRSDARHDRLTAHFVAEEATRYLPSLLDHFDIGPFVAMGHSVGGAMAIESAAAFADRCEALVTISAQVFAEETTLQGIRAAREQFTDPQQRARLAKYHGDKTDWVLEAWIGSWLSPEFADWNLKSTLARVSTRALVIHGDRDEYGAPVHPQLIAQWSSGPVRVEMLAGGGHLPHREQTAHVIELVKTHLG